MLPSALWRRRALLASYMLHKEDGETLPAFLEKKVFAGQEGTKEAPCKEDVEGFDKFMERYAKGLAIERAAVENL